MINFDELTALSDWTNPGTLTLNANSKIDPGDFTINSVNTTITEFASLRFLAGNGTFEVDDGGTFVNEGTINGMTVGDTLKIALASPDLAASATTVGTFEAGTGTVEYDGAVQSIDDENYHNLTISAAGDKTAGQDLVVAGDLNISAGDLAIGNKRLNLTGDFLMSGGSFTAGDNTGHTVGGSWTESGGTFTAGTAGKFTFEAAAGNTTITTNTSFYDLSVETTGNSVSAAAALTVDNDFTMTATNTGNFSAAADLIVTRNFTMAALNTGTFDTEGNTVTVTGATNIDGGILEIAAGIFDADGDFDADGQTVTFTGDGTLKLGGDAGKGLTPNLGTLNDDAGLANISKGTVIYDNQGGDQDIYRNATRGYFNLEIDNDGQIARMNNSAELFVFGDLTITTGNLTSANFDDKLTLVGDFLMNGGEFVPGICFNHEVSGSWNDAGGTFAPGGGTIKLVGAGTTQITSKAGNSFNILTIDGGTHEAQSTITVSNRLNIEPSSTLQMGDNTGSFARTLIHGDLSLTNEVTATDETSFNGGTLSILGTGTYNADGLFNGDGGGGGTVTFTGAGNLVCSNSADNTFGTLTDNFGTVTFDANDGNLQNLPSGETFNNITVSNSNNLVLAGDVTVNNLLTFTSGYINTGVNNLTIGENGLAVVGATDAAHINGNCSKIFNNGSAEAEFNFPVGNGADTLRPIKLIVPAGASTTTFKVKYNHERSTTAGGNIGNGGGVDGSTLNHISGYMDPTTQGGLASDLSNGYYFNITRPSGAKGAQLYLEWSSADTWGTGGGDTESLKFARYNLVSNHWESAGGTLGGLGQARLGNLTSEAILDFSGGEFTLGSTDIGLFLPIDLLSFEGECIDNKTNLEFVVASQVNNDYFTIKRSTNNFEWEEVGYINGGGTNNEEITYTWTDHSPKSGVNYYKLFQTDIDGLSKSFSPIAINCESKVEDYHIYPNPTNGIVSVEFDLEYYQGDDIQMVLKDFKGVIVKSYPIELKRGYNNFEVDLNNLPNGFYVLSYSGTKNHIPSKRIVKL
jgi:hypothetical protein